MMIFLMIDDELSTLTYLITITYARDVSVDPVCALFLLSMCCHRESKCVCGVQCSL